MFVVLGSTNAMKGPLFGTAFLATAMGVYFLAGRHWAGLRRYVWFWGWLAYLAVGCRGRVFSTWLIPDVADIWVPITAGGWARSTSASRRGTTPSTSRGTCSRGRSRPRRPVGRGGRCFASATRLAIPLGLGTGPAGRVLRLPGEAPSLHAELHRPVGPDSVAGAIGLPISFHGRRGCVRPCSRWWHLGVPGTIAALALAHKIPGLSWVAYTVAAGFPIVIAAGWYFATRPDERTALIGFLVVILVVHVAAYRHRTAYLDSYAGDRQLIALSENKSHQMFRSTC